MPIDYGPTTPMDDMPEDLMMAAETSDDMIGDELASMVQPFERPVNPKVMNGLAKGIAAAAKVMGMDIVPEKYTEPVMELEPDVVRFLAMMDAASADYGRPFPIALDAIRDESAVTAITAHLMDLAADKDFEAFLDMDEADAPEADVEINIEAPMPGGGEMDEDFDFASRMR